MDEYPRVLMQLRDCFGGYAGITQETQLLFSSFLESSLIDADGLIVKYGPNDLRKTSRGLPVNPSYSSQKSHLNVKRLSDLIINYQSDGTSSKLSLSKRDLFFLPFILFYLNSITHLGGSISIDHFDARGFENFIWDSFFATTLSASEFKKVTTASFRTLHYPMNVMQLAGWLGLSYPKLNTQGYDIFLAQMPFPGRVAKTTQLVIRYHDAIPLFAPHLINIPKFHQAFHYKALKSNAKSGLFACVSNTVRNDLLRVFPAIAERATVIHDLVSDHFFQEEKSRHTIVDIIASRTFQHDSKPPLSTQGLSTPFRYLLMVSTIEPRKNHTRLIKAWEIVRLSVALNMKLILVGNIGWNCHSIINKMKPWQERGELFHLQNVETSELRLLYKEASCVICPSLMEGFDLSGIEAMLCGAKVAASDIAVHREVYGDAAVYFDAYSIEEQVEAIESIVLSENASFAATLGKRGSQWAKKYQREAILPQWEDFFEKIQAGTFK